MPASTVSQLYVMGRNAAKDNTSLDFFKEVFERVRSDYATKPDDDKMIENAINGMLGGLNSHSNYMNGKIFRDMQVQTRGEFGGIGIELSLDDGFPKVVSAIYDTPADKAGIMADDIVTAIDGQATHGMTINQAIDLLRGPVNTVVKLEIHRSGVETPLEISITRNIIRVIPVRWTEEGNDVGYIRITQFNEATFDKLKDAVDDLTRKLGTDNIKGYIIDLRNNPGGLLDQAIATSNEFLDIGPIVTTEGRSVTDEQKFAARPKGDLTAGKPLIVLINGGTASGSEIMAAALQDNHRATILGSRSFGEGSIQTIIPFGAGKGALRLTTAFFYRPAELLRDRKSHRISRSYRVLRMVLEREFKLLRSAG